MRGGDEMRKLKGYEIATCYGFAGYIAGALTVEWGAKHPNWHLVMGGATGFVVLIVLVGILRLGE
jgi:hypothetical protein